MFFISCIGSPSDHCIEVARGSYAVHLAGDRQLRATLTKCINMHLRKVRALNQLGPSDADFEKYQLAMRCALKRKISY